VGIVIVEGPDGSGKTTLLKNLRSQSTQYFWVMSSSGRPKTIEQLKEAVGYIGQSAYLKLHIICDRFPLISEAVYGPVVRGRCLLDQLDERNQKFLEELLTGEIERIIYCRPPLEQIKYNLKENLQMTGVYQLIEKLVRRYDEVMDELRDSNVKVYNYDYTRSDLYSLDTLFFGELVR
jgi:hypothetical protein